MMPLIVVVVLALVVLWLSREVATARRSAELVTTPSKRRRPQASPQQRIDDATLQERVRVLREAIRRGDVPVDEASASLVRIAGGAMTEERARALLTR